MRVRPQVQTVTMVGRLRPSLLYGEVNCLHPGQGDFLNDAFHLNDATCRIVHPHSCANRSLAIDQACANFQNLPEHTPAPFGSCNVYAVDRCEKPLGVIGDGGDNGGSRDTIFIPRIPSLASACSSRIGSPLGAKPRASVPR